MASPNTFIPDAAPKSFQADAPSTFQPDAPAQDEGSDWLGVGEEVRGVGRGLNRGVRRFLQSVDVGAMREAERLPEKITQAKARVKAAEDYFAQGEQRKVPWAHATAGDRADYDRSMNRELGEAGRLVLQLEQEHARLKAAVPSIAKDFSKQQAAIDQLPQTQAQQDFAKDETPWWHFFKNPFELSAVTLAESAPPMAMTMAAAPLGPVGVATTAGITSHSAESSGRIVNAMAESGVDLKKPEQVMAWFADRAKSDPEIAKADLAAMGPATFDALTAGLAGKFLGPAMGKGLRPVLTATGKEMGLQMAGGGAGSIAGNTLAGEPIDWKDFVLEVAGEFAPGEAFSNVRADAKAQANAQTMREIERTFNASRRTDVQTLRESPGTIAAQMDWLKAGKRPAVMFAGGATVPAVPKGMESVKVGEDTFHFNPALTSADVIKSAAQNDTLGVVLGYGVASKPAPGTEAGVVVVRGKDGTEKQAVVVDEAGLQPAVVAARRVMDEGDTIAIETGDKVLQDRVNQLPKGQKPPGTYLHFKGQHGADIVLNVPAGATPDQIKELTFLQNPGATFVRAETISPAAETTPAPIPAAPSSAANTSQAASGPVAGDQIEYAPWETGGSEAGTSEREDSAVDYPYSQTATPSEPQTTTELAPDGRKVVAVEMPVDSIEVDPVLVPQFKNDADETSGEVRGEELKATRYERPSNPIVIWQLRNGRNIVVTGRHRFALAKRLGEQTIPATIVREADGFTRQHAITLDAEFNIRDGNGSVDDYANYIENHPELTEEEARSRGLLDRAKGIAAFHLARSASDDLKALYKAGKIAEREAVAIASAAPGNAPAQAIGSKFALAGKSAAFIRNVIQASQAEAGQRATSLDLFGQDDSAMQQMEAQAERASQYQREISEQVRAVQGAAKRPDVARKLGVDVQDPAGVANKIVELKNELARWQNWPLHPDLVAKAKGLPPGAQMSLAQDLDRKINRLTEKRDSGTRLSVDEEAQLRRLEAQRGQQDLPMSQADGRENQVRRAAELRGQAAELFRRADVEQQRGFNSVHRQEEYLKGAAAYRAEAVRLTQLADKLDGGVRAEVLLPDNQPAAKESPQLTLFSVNSPAAPTDAQAQVQAIIAEEAGDTPFAAPIHDATLTHEGHIVEGYLDPRTNRPVINAAAPTMRDPANVRRVVREERAHWLLTTPEGQAELRRFTGQMTPAQRAELQRQGYTRMKGESAADYEARLHNEFIAKQARENTAWWRKLVERVREWLAANGLAKLTNEEAARAILRRLNAAEAARNTSRAGVNFNPAPQMSVAKIPKLFRGIGSGGKTLGTFMLGKGVYSSWDKSFAKKYGDVVEVSASEGWPERPLDLRNYPGDGPSAFADWALQTSGMKNMREFHKRYPDPGEFVRSKGFDGVIAGDEVVKYPTDASQGATATKPANPLDDSSASAINFSLAPGTPVSPETQTQIAVIEQQSGNVNEHGVAPTLATSPELRSKFRDMMGTVSGKIHYYGGAALLRAKRGIDLTASYQAAAVAKQSDALLNQLFSSAYNAASGFKLPQWMKVGAWANRTRAFKKRLLHVAARLNATGRNPDGSFKFDDFKVRSGMMTLQAFKAGQHAVGGSFIHIDPQTNVQETFEIGPLVQTPDGRMGYQLLRSMDANTQAELYRTMQESFPELTWLLDMFVDPALADVRQTINGIEIPVFNRFAQAAMMAEADPNFTPLTGYTPDVLVSRSLIGAIRGALSFSQGTRSPGRKYKFGTSRESGHVRDLLTGFNVRTFQMLQEKARREWRNEVFKAAKSIPRTGVPQGWVKLETGMESLFEAAKRLKNFTSPVDPATGLPLFPETEKRMADDGTKEFKDFWGEIFRQRGQQLMLPQLLIDSLLKRYVIQKQHGALYRLGAWGVRNSTQLFLVAPKTYVANVLTNDLFAIEAGTRYALRGLASGDATSLRFSKELFSGIFTNRFAAFRERFNLRNKSDYMTAIREILPEQIFSDSTSLADVKVRWGNSAVDYLRQGEIGAAALQMIQYGSIDTRAKQRMSFAFLKATAVSNAKRAGLKGKALKSAVERYLANPPADDLVQAVQIANFELLNYADSPQVLNDIAQNDYSRLVLPFPRFGYHYVTKQLKRASAAKLFLGKVPKGQRADAFADLVTFALFPAGGAGIAALLAAGLGDDDDDKDARELVGTSTVVVVNPDGSVSRKAIAREYITANRVNISAWARAMGIESDNEDDFWLRVRNYPTVAAAGVTALAYNDAKKHGVKYGALQFAKGAGDLAFDFFSVGAAVKIPFKVAEDIRSETPQGTLVDPYAQSVPLTFYITEQLTDSFIPGSRQADELIAWINPLRPRRTASKTLGYDPGVVEALEASHLSGLLMQTVKGETTLPPAGTIDRRTASVPSPSLITFAERASSLGGFNVKAINRNDYEQALGK